MTFAYPNDLTATVPPAEPPPGEGIPPVAGTCALRATMPGDAIPSRAVHALAAVTRHWGRGVGEVTAGGEIEIGGIDVGDVAHALRALADAGFASCRDAPAGEPCRAALRHGHVGVFPQIRRGMNDVGIAVPVGRLTAHQLDGLAHIAEECGAGVLRITAWQNAIVPDVPETRLDALKRRVRLMGLDIRASSAAASVVACHDEAGLTKAHALEICRHLDRAVVLDTPVDIHVSGAPCAHGAVADIALVGMGEGRYDVHTGGAAARAIWRGLPAVDAPGALARLLNVFSRQRGAAEGFLAFARRHEDAALCAMLVGAG